MKTKKTPKKLKLKLEDQRNVDDLCRLLAILRRKKPVTSHDIARRMRCSNMVARRRLRQIASCGYEFRIGTKRVGERGPEARTYKLARGSRAVPTLA